MNILLNKEKITFREENLPILIHGEEGSGASLYTISLAVNFISLGSRIIFYVVIKWLTRNF